MKLKNIIYIFLIIVIGQNLFAQEDNTASAKTYLFGKNMPEGLALKWFVKDLYFQEGVNVYRKIDGQSWVKLNATPLKPVNNNSGLSSEAAELLKATRLTDYQEFQSSMLKIAVVIEAIKNNSLAEAIGIYFLDKTLENGQAASYKIVQIKNGQETEFASNKFTRSSYEKPSSPVGLTVERSKGKNGINWTIEKEKYYGVFILRSDAGKSDFKYLNKAELTMPTVKDEKGNLTYPEFQFIDSLVYDSLSYDYKLEAIDYFGETTLQSEVTSVKSQDFDFPEAPFNVVAQQDGKTVKINWEKGIKEDDFIGFNIYEASNSESVTWKKLNAEIIPVDFWQFVDDQSQPGPHYYRISSVDKAGNESLSPFDFAELRDLVPPLAPSNLKATADTGKINLTWEKNSEGDIKGYNIYRSISKAENASYVLVNRIPVKENFYTDELPKKAKDYFSYYIVAEDTSYNQSEPSNRAGSSIPDVTPPTQPLLKLVKLTEDGVVINWVKNVEPDLSYYEVYRRISGDTGVIEKVSLIEIPKNITSFSDKEALTKGSYEYLIKAVDESGNKSSFSNAFPMKISKNLGIEDQEIRVSVKESKKATLITWNNIDNVKGYIVYQIVNDEEVPLSSLQKENSFKYSTESKNKLEIIVKAYTLDADIIISKKQSLTFKPKNNAKK